MKKEELTGWFNDEFWPLYQSFVKTPQPTKYKAGAKGEALKKILKENPSEELRERVLSALREQTKHRMDLYRRAGSMQKFVEITAYQKFYANRHAVTWWNQMGWEDEIPSSVEMDETVEGQDIQKKVCCRDGCARETMGPRLDWCDDHYPETMNFDPILKAKLKEMGMWKRPDETVEQWQSRCKAESQQKLRNMGMRA